MVSGTLSTDYIIFLNRLCRLKKKAQAEANATAISNLLPFMETSIYPRRGCRIFSDIIKVTYDVLKIEKEWKPKPCSANKINQTLKP